MTVTFSWSEPETAAGPDSTCASRIPWSPEKTVRGVLFDTSAKEENCENEMFWAVHYPSAGPDKWIETVKGVSDSTQPGPV